jgi:GAF domain-containing protein
MMNATAIRLLQQENIRLTKEVDTLTEKNQILYRYFELAQKFYWASLQISAEANPFKLLNELLYETLMVVEARDGSLSRLDATKEELVFLLVHGDLRHRLRGYRLSSNTGIAGWVVNNRLPIIVNDPRQDWRFSATVDSEFGFLTQSIVSVPMISRNRLLGVIQLVNKRTHEFTEADVTLLLLLGEVAVIALEEVHVRLQSGQWTEEDLLDPTYQEDAPTTAETPFLVGVDPVFAELLQG